MNLSPEWEEVLNDNNIKAVHWSTIGPYNAPDNVLMDWARKSG